MMRFYGAAFLTIMSNLATSFMICRDEEISRDEVDQKITKHLGELHHALEEIKLPSLVAESDRLIGHLPDLTRDEAAALLRELRDSITHELTNHLFLIIKPDFKRLFLQPTPAEPIISAFNRTVPDFEDASRCLALDEPNAAVFHLMRVLEIGLNALACRLNVAFDRRNWQTVINDIEAEIKKIGPGAGANWKELEHFYSEAASHFRFLKNGWRNYVMHVHQRYSLEEAFKIQSHVHDFMQHLSLKLDDHSLP